MKKNLTIRMEESLISELKDLEEKTNIRFAAIVDLAIRSYLEDIKVSSKRKEAPGEVEDNLSKLVLPTAKNSIYDV